MLNEFKIANFTIPIPKFTILDSLQHSALSIQHCYFVDSPTHFR
jgi:hypothetical protein